MKLPSEVCNENTNGAIGWRLDPHDVAVSKLVANRPKDIEFVEAFLKSGAGDANIIRKRLEETEIAHHQIRNMAEQQFAKLYEQAEDVGRLIGGFMRYLQNSEFRKKNLLKRNFEP
ncbi:MAG: hypothetical protein HY360_12290 [Verrucomicrobia bacterium]|nr:hypothetical protein [Verrucomicrobiota bacterium]